MKDSYMNGTMRCKRSEPCNRTTAWVSIGLILTVVVLCILLK